MELEEQAVLDRGRHIAAVIIFTVAFPGTMCNVLVAKFTRTLPTLNNSFGRLTASQAAGEAILCAMFAFYYVPMVFLDIEAMKEFSRYVGIVLLICYDICIFSHLIIALNRMSAIVFPVTHTVHFSNRNTTVLIIIIWTVSIIIPFSLHARSICTLSYSQATYAFAFSSNEVCGQLWYVDFIQDVSIVILIAIIDSITIIKYRLSSAKLAKSTSHIDMSKRKLDKILLKQTVAQGVLFAVGLSMYFFLSRLFQNKWVVWSLTSLAWNIVHLSDAIIIITFNREFRRLICSLLSSLTNICHKTKIYNAESDIAPKMIVTAEITRP